MKNLPVILCIGSEKICGDSLAPIVGDLLIQKYNLPCFVYGTTEHSVNGTILVPFTSFIKSTHLNAPVIAVDACLGKAENVGKIRIIKGGVCPKKAVMETAETVGDIGILGVTQKIGSNAVMQLLSASAETVNLLAVIIALGFFFAVCAVL
jgi:putative sporulation protein YyaC